MMCRQASSSRDTRHAPARRSGFTILELLVVCAIIAVLLAVLIPSMTSARREARRVVCQANLKQVVYGWRSYLEESKGAFLQKALGDINYGGRQGSFALYRGNKPVNKHLKLQAKVDQGADLFSCPDDTGGGTDPNNQMHPNEKIAPSFFNWYGTSYFANPLLVGPAPYAFGSGDGVGQWLSEYYKKKATRPITLPQIDYESRVLLVADGVWQKAWNYSNKDPILQWHNQKQKYNVGFVDGHVGFVEVRKGIYVSSQYTVLPTKEMQSAGLLKQKDRGQ